VLAPIALLVPQLQAPRAPIASAARSFPPAKYWSPWAAAVGHPLPPLAPPQAFPAIFQFPPKHPHRRSPSAASSCSPWAARSEPSHATTTPQPALHQPREAPRPNNWSPRALHRLPDELPVISTAAAFCLPWNTFLRPSSTSIVSTPSIPHLALKLLDYFPAHPDHRSTLPAVLPHRRPHCLRRAITTARPDPIPVTHRCALTWSCFSTLPPSPPAIAVTGTDRSNPGSPL
jgi:hypothetical protein